MNVKCDWTNCPERATDITIVHGQPHACCAFHTGCLIGDPPAFQDPEPELRDYS